MNPSDVASLNKDRDAQKDPTNETAPKTHRREDQNFANGSAQYGRISHTIGAQDGKSSRHAYPRSKDP